MADFAQGLEITEAADGSIVARLVVQLPNGARRTFVERLTPDDGAHAARVIAAAEAGTTVAAAREPRVRDFVNAADFGWSTLTVAQRKKYGDVRKWWAAAGKDNRISGRASFAALKAERPNDTPAEAAKWWRSLSSKYRQKLRKRHTPGYDDNFLDEAVAVVKKVDRAIDKSALGKVAQVALPALAVGRWSVKNPAAAASFIPGGSAAAQGIKTGAALLPAAKKLAAGKVMESAAASLEATGNSSAAAGAAKLLRMQGELTFADAAAELGAPRAASVLADKARAVARRSSPAVGRAALELADKTRENIAKLARGGKPAASKAAPSKVLAAARAGRVRSNKPGTVSPAELDRALRQGRVFFVEASR